MKTKNKTLEGKVQFDLMTGPVERLMGLAQAVVEMQMEVRKIKPCGYIDVKIMLTCENGERVNASGLTSFSVMQAHGALILMQPINELLN